MIIVSQDKDNVVNFDRIKSLWIDDNVLDRTNTTFEILADDESLGEYATEERAKEVLREITSTFSIKGMKNVSYEYADIWVKMRQCAIYEMPKE